MQHIAFGIGLGSRNRRRRTEVSRNEGNLHACHLFCHRHCLLRIARVVANFQFQLPAEQATRRIDLGNGQFSAVLELLTEARLRAGHRADHGNTDILGHRDAGHCQAGAKRKKISSQRKRHHILLGGLSRLNASPLMNLPERDDHPGSPFSRAVDERLGQTRRGVWTDAPSVKNLNQRCRALTLSA